MSGGLQALLSSISPPVAGILALALEGRDLDVEQAVALCQVTGAELHALCMVADHLREAHVGAEVTYVVNRNINFTNVCAMACKFCAFSRTKRSTEGYFLSTQEVVERALTAQRYGATEVCVQAGLPPEAAPDLYTSLIAALRRAAPTLHIHAMSPEEVRYGARLAGQPVSEFLLALKEAGLSSLPGTSAEILDDGVRKRLAGARISSAEWIDVITTAHALGLPTTATIMHGHIETDRQRVQHLATLRSIQRETRGFSELVPLSFVHSEAPLHFKRMVPEVRPGPSGHDVVRLYAIARLMLGADFKNIQASWVKEGEREVQRLLDCGVNDVGGTLMNESISTAAGARHGQLMSPASLRRLIREAGRPPVQRDTLYRPLKRFGQDALTDPPEPLDAVQDAEMVFGSYIQLTERARLRSKEA